MVDPAFRRLPAALNPNRRSSETFSETSHRIPVPESLAVGLARLERVTKRAPDNEAKSRGKLDLILLTVLSDFLASFDNDQHPALRRSEELNMQYETKLERTVY